MNSRAVAALAYAGTLPFVGSALLAVTGTGPVPVLGSGPEIAIAWALTIAAFMAGAHWGLYLSNGDAIGFGLPVASNAIAILGWLAFLSLPQQHALLVFAALFAILLVIDHRLLKAGLIEHAYWRTRAGVTAIVIAALLVTAIFA